MGVVSYLPLTHSNHSMLRTLLALGVFLIPQVSSLGYWPYGGYGLHPHGGYGLHPHGGYGLHPHGAGWGLGFGHPALHGGLGYPFGMAGLYGGLLGGDGYGGGKGYGGSYGGYGGGKGYGKGSKNYGNKGYGNSRYRRSIRGTPSYHTPTSPAHHTAHTYQPMSSYGVHQAYQPFVRYQPVRFSPAHQYSAGRFYTPRQRYGEMHYGQQPYHGRYYARQPVRSYPGYSTRNIMY